MWGTLCRASRLAQQRDRQFWGWREQSDEIGRLGGGVKGACRRAKGVNPASIPLRGMGQRLVAIGALLVHAIFEQMSLQIFGSEACCVIDGRLIYDYDAWLRRMF